MTVLARWAILIFSFLGIADSAYLAQHATNASLPSCSINGVDGCRVVAESAYTHLFGLPLGAYGVAFYGVVFALAAVSLIVTHAHVTRTLRVLAAFGVLASLIFLAIQIFLIGALCLYCETSAALTVLILVATWWRPRRATSKSASQA